MDIDVESLPIRNNEADGAFEIELDGHVAKLEYVRRGDVIYYPHTFVPRELEGHGIAARLAKYALDYARANGLSVVPRCPYVRSYLERHPEYQDLVVER